MIVVQRINKKYAILVCIVLYTFQIPFIRTDLSVKFLRQYMYTPIFDFCQTIRHKSNFIFEQPKIFHLWNNTCWYMFKRWCINFYITMIPVHYNWDNFKLVWWQSYPFQVIFHQPVITSCTKLNYINNWKESFCYRSNVK